MPFLRGWGCLNLHAQAHHPIFPVPPGARRATEQAPLAPLLRSKLLHPAQQRPAALALLAGSQWRQKFGEPRTMERIRKADIRNSFWLGSSLTNLHLWLRS